MARKAAAGWWQHRQEWEQPAYPDTDPVDVAAWTDADDLRQVRARFMGFSPPLGGSPPVRILLAGGPGEDRVILNAHHAALDGISCLDLLRSLARHYQAHVSGVAAPGAPAATATSAPTTAGPAADPGGRGLPGTGLPGTGLRPVARIARDRRDAGPRGSRCGYGFALLDIPVPALPRAGQGPHATVNDVLIAALIVTIGRWNASHGRPGDRIRITMPINSRAPGQDGAAGNLSRLAAVTASPPADGSGFSSLLSGVAAQTRWAKEHAGPQVDLVSRALAAAPGPPAVKRVMLRLALRMAGPLLCDTSLVSNLGIVADPPWFGYTRGCGLWFSTSAHMPRGLSVGAVTAGGQLQLCLRYRRALLSEPAAGSFASAYVSALNDVCGDAAADPSTSHVPSPGASQ